MRSGMACADIAFDGDRELHRCPAIFLQRRTIGLRQRRHLGEPAGVAVSSYTLSPVGFYGGSDGYWAPEPRVALVDTPPGVQHSTSPRGPRRAAWRNICWRALTAKTRSRKRFVITLRPICSPRMRCCAPDCWPVLSRARQPRRRYGPCWRRPPRYCSPVPRGGRVPAANAELAEIV